MNNKYSEYNFISEFKKGETLGLQLDEGICFFFSGKYLKHRQRFNENNARIGQSFISVASYGTEQLYNHIKATFNRVKK